MPNQILINFEEIENSAFNIQIENFNNINKIDSNLDNMIDKDLKIDNHELKETKKNGIIKTKNNIFNLNEIYYENTKINEIVNMVLKKYQPFIKMYLNIYKEHDICKLHRLQNLLYYIIFNITLLLFFYI